MSPLTSGWHQPGARRVWRARLATRTDQADRLTLALGAIDAQVDTLVMEPLADPGTKIMHLILVTRPDVNHAQVAEALADGGSDVIVTKGTEDDLDDFATRVLKLATRLAADPEAAPSGAAALVFADSWEVTSAVEGEDASPYVMRLQWSIDKHVILRRTSAAFTNYDRGRAAALLELVAALARVRGADDELGWLNHLAGGDDITVRLARPRDERAVAELHGRCTERTLFQRYFAPMSQWREDNLRRISGQHRGATLVVTDEGKEVIALANVFPEGPDDRETAEIALLVDDAWQGRGVGRVLLEHVVDIAARLGFTRLVAYVLAENPAMTGLLLTSGQTWTRMKVHDMGASVIAFECLLIR